MERSIDKISTEKPADKTPERQQPIYIAAEKPAEWTSQQSAALYGIGTWGNPYFRVNESGNIDVHPEGKEKKIDLFKLVEDLRARGLRIPLLVRFPDLIRARINLIADVFAKSIESYGYKGKYCGVFPIKVNQQRHVVEEIAQFGSERGLGLECGSKAELLVSLALVEHPDALIICNGFKDQEYIETALLSQKLGRNTIVVIDRYDELEMIIKAHKKLKISPRIGFRVKLNTQGAGRWVESSGAKSKFGLTPSELVEGVGLLKAEGLMSSLELLHFHIGSQIPSIQSVKGAVKEGTRYFTELYNMGAPLRYFDVGGGLGVDYDGSGKSDGSTNYTEQEYANDVVTIIQSICDEKKVPHPHIVSESGRSIVAHSSILIFDILGFNEVAQKELTVKVTDKDSRLVHEMMDIYNDLNLSNLNEYYNDLIEKKRDTQQLFSYGVLSLEQLAKAEELYWTIAAKMHRMAKGRPDSEDIFWAFEKEQSDMYFCNFSVFQSLPDSWAVNQRFPMMPIHRLNEAPTRRATLADLTCDSDGKIDSFNDFESDDPQSYLEVHALEKNKPYYMAVFLAGAYQETLGDLHNLFGDTDAAHISLSAENGYTVDTVVRGDAINTVLSYVQYDINQLVERLRRNSEAGIYKGRLTHEEARLLMNHYVTGLSGYTYLQTQSQD